MKSTDFWFDLAASIMLMSISVGAAFLVIGIIAAFIGAVVYA